ncbi:alpha/beta fold hydrolase [Dactylosporangium darangshiense]
MRGTRTGGPLLRLVPRWLLRRALSAALGAASAPADMRAASAPADVRAASAPDAMGARPGRRRLLRVVLWPLRRLDRRRSPAAVTPATGAPAAVTPAAGAAGAGAVTAGAGAGERAAALRELAATMGLDARLVADSEGTLEDYRDLATPVLLLGGGRSPRYLRRTLRRLAAVLPDATLTVRRRAGHDVPTDTSELREFFQRRSK